MIDYIKGILFLALVLGSIWFIEIKYENTIIPLLFFVFLFLLWYVGHKAYGAGLKDGRRGIRGIDDEHDPSGNDNMRRNFYDYM